jgi:hypothetical protein
MIGEYRGGYPALARSTTGRIGEVISFGRVTMGPHYHVVLWRGQLLPSVVVSADIEIQRGPRRRWIPAEDAAK